MKQKLPALVRYEDGAGAHLGFVDALGYVNVTGQGGEPWPSEKEAESLRARRD